MVRARQNQDGCTGIVANPAIFIIQHGKEQGSMGAIPAFLDQVNRLRAHHRILGEEAWPLTAAIADSRARCLTAAEQDQSGQDEDQASGEEALGAPEGVDGKS